MSPAVKLHLVQVEMERWMRDVRPEPERERVHADRVARILGLEYADTRHAVIVSS
jgi:hypothetical protein